MEKNEINYTKFTIVQASQVKEEWYILNWKRNEVTIASIDAIAIYPSIKFPLVKKAISYFTGNLPKSQQSTIKLCPKLIAFWVSSTLLTFEDKYYEYGEKGIKTKGLAIGLYESDFLADLVASYLFEKYSNQFKNVLWKGIYRDDGLLVFKGKKSLSEIKRWREDFQSRVNKIAGNEYLKFTCKILMPNTSSSRDKQDYVLEIVTNNFPYLDLEFLWNADR